MTADDPRIIAYPTSGALPDIRPARPTREWMDALPDKFAYRCLPLNMANALGWEIGAPCGFTALWDGGDRPDAIQVLGPPGAHGLPVSHFGHGVLTFHVTVLLRTPPGVNLLATGPLNHPKDGISPLAGVVETDWSPYAFTMNWKFTAAHAPVSWAAGEPFVQLIPLPRGLAESLTPETRQMDDDPELAAQHRAWAASRLDFNAALDRRDDAARRQGWQKDYFRGRAPDGTDGAEDHQTKTRSRPFPGAKS